QDSDGHTAEPPAVGRIRAVLRVDVFDKEAVAEIDPDMTYVIAPLIAGSIPSKEDVAWFESAFIEHYVARGIAFGAIALEGHFHPRCFKPSLHISRPWFSIGRKSFHHSLIGIEL